MSEPLLVDPGDAFQSLVLTDFASNAGHCPLVAWESVGAENGFPPAFFNEVSIHV
jgi:hypothetical protein